MIWTAGKKIHINSFDHFPCNWYGHQGKNWPAIIMSTIGFSREAVASSRYLYYENTVIAFVLYLYLKFWIIIILVFVWLPGYHHVSKGSHCGMSANQTFTVLLFCPPSNIHKSALEKEKQWKANCKCSIVFSK